MATTCRTAVTSVLILALAAGNVLVADTSQPAITAQNVQSNINGAVVTVTFDLPAQAGTTYTVSMEASDNGGLSFDIKPKTMTGDFGKGIAGGPGRQIVWEAARDTENLQLGRLRFRVSAVAERPAAEPAGTQTTGQPTATRDTTRGMTGVQPPSPMTPPAGKRGSPPLKWTGLTMMAAGGTIAVLAAAGPLKSDCVEFSPRFAVECESDTEINKAALGLGAGIAAGGAALWLLGRGREAPAEVVPIARGVFIRGRVKF
jgi:hypothetical protein